MAVEIIAELAQGFEGHPRQAELLVRAAAAAGVDAVKLQLIYADEIATPDYKYYNLYRQLEMSFDVWSRLAAQARDAGLAFYLDVSGDRSLAEAATLNAAGVKISTSNFFNVPLVERALQLFPRVFLGVGGITVDEIDAFIVRHHVRPGGPLRFLYGLQAEPTPTADTNLAKLGALQRRFPGHAFGYMDHAEGGHEDAELLALLALPFGPACIEKHLSLDRSLQLEDYVSALTPAEMRVFVQRVRRFEAGLGSGLLDLSEPEHAYRRMKLKVVVAKRNIAPGTRLTIDDLELRRVSDMSGAVLHLLSDAVGCVSTTAVETGRAVTAEVLAP
ncbi:MAG: sialic acid synthase [Acidimicrobiia bacterium]